ncbi:MAG: DUF2202 domain-containing protein [Corynebacterium sp.]|jgi:hypothetical protein|nr:DUF2202 domain-containing protein [Corynebacterium sp.]
MASTTFPRRRTAALMAASSAAALVLGLAACTSDDPAGPAESTAADATSASDVNSDSTGASTADATESASTSATDGNGGAAGDVDPQTADDLQFTLEEERMARDLYTALGEKWGTRPFLNIAPAEQRHMDAVVDELDGLGLPSDSKDGEPGVFSIGEIQDLYDGWLERGLTSESEALAVGAELERRDIADLEGFVARTDDPALKDMYEFLLAGSRNHLRAFETAGGAGGGAGAGAGRGGGPAQANG